MVAEATPEVQTGNTDEPLANAVHPEVQAFLDDENKGSEKLAPETTQAQADAPADDFPELTAAKNEAVNAAVEQTKRETANRLEREALDRQKSFEQQQAEQRHRDSYIAGVTQRPEELAAWLRQQGLDEPAVAAAKKWATDWANNHHGLGLSQYGPMAKIEAEANQVKAFNDAAREHLSPDGQRAFFGSVGSPTNHKDIDTAVKALVESSSAGMVTKAEATAMATKKLNDFIGRLEKEGKLVGVSNTRQVSGSLSSGRGQVEPKNLREAEEMHAGLHASGRKLTNDEMRRYQTQFTERKG